MATITTDTLSLLRLLQLSSPSLPVGAYAYSQGLESAVAIGWVSDPDALEHWLAMQLHYGLARVDLPLMFRLHEALLAGDEAALADWNDYALACRESRELLQGDLDAAEAMARLLLSLDVPLRRSGRDSVLSIFMQAVIHWKIPPDAGLTGWLWAWLENQVVAATKLMPLGQTRAQQLLSSLQALVPDVLTDAAACSDADIGACLPALAIASMQHETQYSRLFRS